MIKGTERRIIVVERVDDPYFEKAVFFLRCGATPSFGGQSLSKRAQEIYDSMLREGENKGGVPPEQAPKKTPKGQKGRRQSFFSRKRGQVGEKGGN